MSICPEIEPRRRRRASEHAARPGRRKQGTASTPIPGGDEAQAGTAQPGRTTPPPESAIPEPAPADRATAPGRFVEGRARHSARWLVLGALVVLTSWAIERAFSGWLIPGYLGLVAWLVAGPRASGPETPAGPASTRAARDESTEPAPGGEGRSSDPPGGAGPAPGEPEAAPRPRRRTRRPKMPPPPPEPPAEAVWVRVGPGKFVRVERDACVAGPDAPGIDPPPVEPEPSSAPPPPADHPTAEVAPRERVRAVRIDIPEQHTEQARRPQLARPAGPPRWRATRTVGRSTPVE